MNLHYLIILLSIISINCRFIPFKTEQFISNENIALLNEETGLNRLKREVALTKSDDGTYNFEGNKIFTIDEDKIVKLNAVVNGIDPSGKQFNEAKGDIGVANSRGGLTFSLDHIKNELNKLGADGKINIFHTPNKKLDISAYFQKDFNLKTDDIYTKYGANLDFITREGSKATANFNHDSLLGDKLKADGTFNILKTDDSILNAKASWARDVPLGGLKPITDGFSGSLNYLNRNGNAAFLAAEHIPNIADTLTAAGKVNLFHNDNHNIDASGRFIQLFPVNPAVDNYNTYSGNIDYNYKDKLGLNVGMEHSSLNQRTDYSALGNLNLYRDPDSSVDLNAGLKKTITPSFSSPIEPSFGVTFKKSW